MFVELGMFEIATFLSQFDGTAALATVVVLFQFIVCFYTVPVGIATSTAMLIGMSLFNITRFNDFNATERIIRNLYYILSYKHATQKYCSV